MGGRTRPRVDAAMTDAGAGTRHVTPLAEVTIRKARPADVEDVAAIERRAFSDPWSANSFRALFGNPIVHFVVAEDRSTARLVGYLVMWFVVDESEIANLAVSEDARRAGVGARLLDHALTAARERRSAVVFLEVRESNAAARALYASRGFEIAGRRAKYYRKPVEDALVLRRGL
jgi:[ribosomal protein S18]-alanine N-acetyltransferase